MTVIDPSVVRHVIKHPARGRPWTLRELAPALGCSPAMLSNMSTGSRATVPSELAVRFCEAVGVEVAVLFAPRSSTDSDTSAVAV